MKKKMEEIGGKESGHWVKLKVISVKTQAVHIRLVGPVATIISKL